VVKTTWGSRIRDSSDKNGCRGAELLYFRGCPSVPNARKALETAGVPFNEVIQDELSPDDPRRKYCSPSLLVDGEVIIGAPVEEASCTLDRWDSPATAKLLRDLGGKSIPRYAL